MRDSDTIFALATPPGRSALAILRISGPRSGDALQVLTGRSAPEPRRASVRHLVDTAGAPIDEAVITYFPGPRSFTGENLAEITVHGGRSVIASLHATLGTMDGLRVAEPGEFTRRAFRNGRIDLTQAEAIADLIDSETEFQRRQALRVLGGALGDQLNAWRGKLVDISAQFESFLDFSDEADVADFDATRVISACDEMLDAMQLELVKSARTLALRNGFTVAIAGPPNAGKSSLFNLLCGDEAAIVTSIPGTTRDIISRVVDLDGVPVTFLDTAGLRLAQDEVEAIGVARAEEAARTADLVLWLTSADCVVEAAPDFGSPLLRVHSKSDLDAVSVEGMSISIYNPASVQELRTALAGFAADVVGDGTEGGLIRERHKCGVLDAVSAIQCMRSNVEQGVMELAAEDCRMALKALAGLVGEAAPDEILGEIFSRFCIGK
jgi:tRNA modification GTPase